MEITNTQKGARGVNTVNGPVLLEPQQTVDVEVYAREKEHLEATGWFDIKGGYTANPDSGASVSAASTSESSSEIEGLKKQLAERDAELAKLKTAKPDEAPKTATEVLAMASNPDVPFMSFKSAATKLLGDKTPSKKDEIVAALEEMATQP